MNDARGDDVIAYYANTIGYTRALAVTGVSAQTPDADGALEPGRWLLQVLDLSGTATRVWLAFGKFEQGLVIVATVGAPCFPLGRGGLISVEFNARRRDNDRVAAISQDGTATLYLTRLSRSE